MKKPSLIINIVLAVAVAVLYVLHFMQIKEAPQEKHQMTSPGPVGEVTAVYVNLDTLLNNLDLYFDMQNKLAAKQKESQVQLDNRTKTFESSVKDLEEKMQKGLITRSNAMKMQENLQVEQQNIMKMRENLTYKLAEEEQVMTRNVMNEIVEYVKEYNKDKNYQFVINTMFGGTLLYGNDNLNITQDIIDGMNARFSKEKENK